MNHTTSRRIDGICTSLVELTLNDAAAVINLRNNPDNNRYLSSQVKLTVQMQRDWIASEQARDDSINFKIVDSDGAFQGTISIYRIADGAAEFGRFIAPNSLYAVEAEYLILKLGFEQLGLQRIYGKTVTENKKVWKQHYRFGLRDAGTELDSRINKTVIIQDIRLADFQQFDYSPLLRLVERWKTKPSWKKRFVYAAISPSI